MSGREVVLPSEELARGKPRAGSEMVEFPEIGGVKEVEAIHFPYYGERYRARVKAIFKGRYGQFRDLSRLIENAADDEERERLERLAESPAVKIVFEVPELGVEGEDVIRISYHRNSRMMQLAACYPDGIKVGDTVEVELQENGRLRIVCPPKQRR